MTARPAADIVVGTADADALTGGALDDLIFAGGGDDMIRWNAGDGRDFVDGGAGTDTFRVVSGTVEELNLAAARTRFQDLVFRDDTETVVVQNNAVIAELKGVERVEFNKPATGAPIISDITPTEGLALSSTLANIRIRTAVRRRRLCLSVAGVGERRHDLDEYRGGDRRELHADQRLRISAGRRHPPAARHLHRQRRFRGGIVLRADRGRGRRFHRNPRSPQHFQRHGRRRYRQRYQCVLLA